MKEHFTRKHKGFTLVELLIVIVVIGILSAMMMLSSSEAVSSAKATAIISDLRNLKTAALAYFADHADTWMTKKMDNKMTEINIDDVLPYLNGKDFPSKKSYKVVSSNDGQAWYVQCSIAGDDPVVKGTEQAAIKKKLAGRAKSVGLLYRRQNPSETPIYYDGTTESGNYVVMLVQ